jgi:hypothetical protein
LKGKLTEETPDGQQPFPEGEAKPATTLGATSKDNKNTVSI